MSTGATVAGVLITLAFGFYISYTVYVFGSKKRKDDHEYGNGQDAGDSRI